MSSTALPVREGIAPVRDRLAATIFLAALLHGIVILGITFGGPSGASSGAPGMKVLLVSDELPEADRNDSARYLAQRTQLGSGTGAEATVLRNRGRAGEPGEAPVPEPTDTSAGERLLATTSPRPSIRYFGVVTEPRKSRREQQVARSQSAEVVAGDDLADSDLEGEVSDELWTAPDTRESVIAPYLDAWRRKVERLGTMNYPAAARRTAHTGNPVLEVGIDSSGALQTAVIRQSSGSPELDDAAISILRLASPFEPFPKEMAEKYRVLRFAYAWEFEQGRAQRGTLVAPADSQ